MTVKDYLGQARRLDQQINDAIKEAEHLRDLVSSVGASSLEPHYNPNHPTEAPFVRGLEKVWEMERKIDAKIDRLVDLKEQITGVIGALPDAEERMVLTYRYLHNMTWSQIGARLYADPSTVRRWHASALKHICLPENCVWVCDLSRNKQK